MRFLLVDADLQAAEALAATATELGHDCVLAQNGAEALRAAGRQGAFDLIVLDIALPDMNGREVCLRLRASEKYASCRIVALSGLAEIGEGFDTSCFDAFYTKPPTSPEAGAFLSLYERPAAQPKRISDLAGGANSNVAGFPWL